MYMYIYIYIYISLRPTQFFRMEEARYLNLRVCHSLINTLMLCPILSDVHCT